MPSRKPNIKARNHNLQLKELQDTFENNAMDVYSNAKRHQIPKALKLWRRKNISHKSVVSWTSDWTAWTYLKLKDNFLIAEDNFVLLTMFFMKLSYMDEKQELRIRKNVQLKGVFYWNG